MPTIKELAEKKAKEIAQGLITGHEKAAEKVKELTADKEIKELEDRWFKAFAKRDVKALEDMEKDIVAQYEAKEQSVSANAGADGGLLVPISVEARIIERQYATSQLRQLATVLSGVTGKLQLNTEGDTVEAYWAAEGALATESTQKFGSLTLQPEKVVGFAKFTDEVLTQTASNPSIRDFVVNRLAQAVNRLEAAAFVTGDGTGKPMGFRNAAGVNALAQAGATLSADDLMKLYRKLPSQYRANAAWLANDSVLGVVDLLKDGSGRYILNGLDGDTDTIKRRPVYSEANIPTNLGAGLNESEVWFGDWSNYIIADGSGLRIDYGTEGDDFKRSKISVRLIKYVDGGVANAAALAKLTAVK